MPIETIIIEFQVNTDPLTQGQAKVAASVKGVSTEFEKLQQQVAKEDAVVSKLTASLSSLSKESKKGVESLLKLGGKEIIAGFEKMGLSVDDYIATLKKAKDETKGTGDETLKAAQKLKLMREELIKLAAAGKENTKEFVTLQKEAGKLADDIGDVQARIKAAGSDTAVFDGLINSVQGLAGGFAVVQGAAAIFGDESEELQETLLRVNAAMAVLQGLQQVQQVLQKESAASLLLLNTQRKIEVIQTNLATAAESKNIVVRYAAAVAQKALNLVMSLNPIGAVITALLLLTTALVYFTSNAKAAAIEQGKLNAALDEATILLDAGIKGYENSNKKIIADLKERGATESEILRQDLDTKKLIIRDTENSIRNLRKSISENVNADTKEANDRLTALEQDLEAKKTELYVSEADARKQFRDEQWSELKKRTEEEQALEKEVADKRKATLQELAAAEAAKVEATRKHIVNEIALRQLAQKDLDKESGAYRDLEVQIIDLTGRLKTLGEEGAKVALTIRETQDEIDALYKGQLATVEQTNLATAKNYEITGQKIIDGQVKVDNKMKDIKVSDLEFSKEKDKERLELALQTAQQITGIFAEAFKQQTENELRRVDDQRKRVDDLKEAGAISEKEAERRLKQLDEKERQIKLKAAQRDKQVAIFQAIIATAAAVAKALPAIPLAIAAGALGAAQIALIAARPIPKFKGGKKDRYEGLGIVGEAGAELIERNGRMEVAAQPQLTWLNASDKVYTPKETASMLMELPPAAVSAKNKSERIDYDRIGKSIAKHMPANHIDINERGIQLMVKKGIESINYLGKRRKF